ncbi:MAG: hypothetical protein R2684_13535 [Pyrinomonadaceae bacterium]
MASSIGAKSTVTEGDLCISGRIVAYDRLASLANLRSSRQAHGLLVGWKDVEHKESEIIFVKYEGFKLQNESLRKIFTSKAAVAMQLVRKEKCDSSLEKLEGDRGEFKIDRFFWSASE